jgi:hypothetical protein
MNVTRRDAAGVLGAALAVGLVLRSGEASADCPNITKALEALQKAQGDLQRAAHDYGGHRQEALNAVNTAIDQLGKCLQAAQCK